MRIRDPGWKKVRSGIRDKHPGSSVQLCTPGAGSHTSLPYTYTYRYFKKRLNINTVQRRKSPNTAPEGE
jgi:hypothetical protein